MNFSTIVEIAIGLIVVYLALSLLVAEIQELLATVFEWRARNLKTSISNLLSRNAKSKETRDLINSIYENPLIQSLNQHASWRKSQGPSYLPSDIFASVLLLSVLSQLDSTEAQGEINLEQLQEKLQKHELREKLPKEGLSKNLTMPPPNAQVNLEEGKQHESREKLPEGLSKNLTTLLANAQVNLEEGEQLVQKFKAEISTWFDYSMERASGVYRRNAKGVTLLVGFILAVLIDVDSIRITQELSKSEILRSSLSSLAAQIVNENASCFNTNSVGQECVKDLKDEVNTVLNGIPNLPLGRSGNFPANLLVDLSWTKFMGWVLTTLALSRGATFWFDLLTRVIGFRNTGEKPSA